MKVRRFILLIGFLTLISLAVLTFILNNVDPYDTSIFIFILFYFSFFIAISGLFILAGFYFRKIFIKSKIDFRLLQASFRQGIWISVILTVFLLLRSFRIL